MVAHCRFIRCVYWRSTRRFQVRIPLDSSGQKRLDVGCFDSLDVAMYERNEILRRAGCSIVDRGRAIREKLLRALESETTAPDRRVTRNALD